jgi:integrase
MQVPSYRKHSSGQARVSINGRDYLLGTYGSKESQAKYNRLLGEWFASNQSKSFGVPVEQLTVSQVLLAYVQYARKHYGTAQSSEFHLIKPALSAMRTLYGPTPASSFGPLQFKVVRDHLAKSGNRSRQHVNRLGNRIKRMLRWAAAQSMIPPSIPQSVGMVEPLKHGRTNLRETEGVEPVSPAVVEATLPHLSKVVADMVRFQLLTGCRPGEVCSIQPCLVDRSGEVWEVKLRDHKTAWRGKNRVIYVPKAAQEILAKYLERPADAYCFSPKDTNKHVLKIRSENRTTPLSCGNKPGTNRVKRPKRVPGASYTTGSYGRAIARACLKAFPPPESLTSEKAIGQWNAAHSWAPNQLRHTFATKVRREHGLEVASILLGHSDVGVTQIYAEKDTQKAVAAIQAMGASSMPCEPLE